MSEREARYLSSKAQSILKDHSDFLLQVRDEVLAAYSTTIPLTGTMEEIAKTYIKQQAAKDGINLFIKFIHEKANERN